MMQAPTFTAADVARLLALDTHRVYGLEQVAEMTGFSLRRLQLACRRGKVEHTRDGNSIGMTLAQVDLLVASRRSGKTEVRGSEVSDEALAIAMSRRAANRAGRWRHDRHEHLP